MAETDQGKAETVRVTVAGHGIDLTRDVSIDLLPQLIGLLVGPSAPGARSTSTIHTDQGAIHRTTADVSRLERPVGVAEYVREKRPQTSSDTILVLAGYLELHERRRPFGRDDLRRLMRIARLAEPANFPRDVGVAVGKGYIQPLEDGFQLTNTALELIGQPGPVVAGRGRVVGPRRSPGAREDED